MIETFSTFPTDIDKSADVVQDASGGNPGAALRTDGNQSYWIGNAARWYANGDFTYTFDYLVNPTGTGRDIYNQAFWLSADRQNGFAWRFDSAGSVFLKISAGVHNIISTNAGQPADNTWYRVTITATGTKVRVRAVRISDSVALLDTQSDLVASIDGSHPTSGYFGQHPDAAGSAAGTRIDNVTYTPAPGLTFRGLFTTADGSNVNFTNVPIGTAASDRLVIVMTESRDAYSTTATVTVNGTALSHVVTRGGAIHGRIIAWGYVTSGTGNVTVNVSGGMNGKNSIYVWTLEGAGTNVQQKAAAYTDASSNTSIDTEDGGWIVAAVGGLDLGWSGATWTSLGKIDQQSQAAMALSAASMSGTQAGTVSVGAAVGGNVAAPSLAILSLYASPSAWDQTPADTVGITDARTVVLAAARTVADPVGVTDSATAVLVSPPPEPVVRPSYEIRTFNTSGVQQKVLAGASVEVTDELNTVGYTKAAISKGGDVTGALSKRVEVALFRNGVEIDNTRALLVEKTSNPGAAMDAGGLSDVQTWGGKTLLGRLAKAQVYPENWPTTVPGSHTFVTQTAGSIFKTLLNRAQARGAIPMLTHASWSATLDSAGVPWGQTLNIAYDAGVTLLAVLENLVRLGVVDVRMVGRDLRLYKGGTWGVDRTLGSSPVILRRGQNVTDAPVSESTDELGNAILVVGDEGTIFERVDAASVALYGREETSLSQGGMTDTGSLTVMADASLGRFARERGEYTCQLNLDAASGPKPWLDFYVGDWVWLDIDGTLKRFRVRQISLTTDGDRTSCVVTLNDKFAELDLTMLKKVEGIIGGASQDTVQPADPDPGDDTTVPKAPTGIGASSIAYLDDQGQPKGLVTVSWAAVTENVGNTTITDLAGYRVYMRNDGSSEPWQLIGDVAADVLTTVFSPVQVGSYRRFTVAAYDSSTHTSAMGTEARILVATDATPPNQPSAPVVTSRLGVLTAAWDAKDSGGSAMPVDFSHVIVHRSQTTGFTPSSATAFSRMEGAGLVVISDLTYGQTWYVKFVAYDRAGNASVASAQGSGTVTKTVTGDIAADAITQMLMAPDAVIQETILAGSIGVSRLAISDTSNYVELNETNVGIVTQTSGVHQVVSGWSSRTVNTSAALRLTNRAGPLPFKYGDRLRFRFRAKVASGSATVTPKVWYYDAGGTPGAFSFPSVDVTTTDTFFDVETDYPTPSDNHVTWLFEIADVTNVALSVKDCRLSLMNAGQLLVDGGVLAEHLAANSVRADSIEAGAVSAEKLAALLVLVSKICSAETGRRWEADEWGIRVYAADGSVLVNLPTDPNTAARFYGDVVASTLTVEDQFSLRGVNNQISREAALVLASTITPPSTRPTVVVGWDTQGVDQYVSSMGSYRKGLASDGTYWYGAMNEGTSSTWQVHIYRWSMATGLRDAGFDIPLGTPSATYNQGLDSGCLTVMGGVLYLITRPSTSWWTSATVWRYTIATQSPVGGAWVWTPSQTMKSGWHPVIGNDGTSLIIGFVKSSDSAVKFEWVSTTGTVGTLASTTSTPETQMAGLVYGNFDMGSARIFYAEEGSSTKQAKIKSLSGSGSTWTRQAAEDFAQTGTTSGHIDGLTWDTVAGRFVSQYRDKNQFYTSNKPGTGSTVWWASNTWYDPDGTGGTHETDQGPRTSFQMYPRAKITITTAPIPPRPVPTTTDDATNTRVYLGRGATDPGRTKMERQTDPSSGVTLLVLTSVTIPNDTNDATNQPPATNGFLSLALTPGRIQSTDSGKFLVKGDGSGNWHGITADTTTARVTKTVKSEHPLLLVTSVSSSMTTLTTNTWTNIDWSTGAIAVNEDTWTTADGISWVCPRAGTYAINVKLRYTGSLSAGQACTGQVTVGTKDGTVYTIAVTPDGSGSGTWSIVVPAVRMNASHTLSVQVRTSGSSIAIDEAADACWLHVTRIGGE